MPAAGEGHGERWEQGDHQVRPYSGPQSLDAELLGRRVVRLWGPLDDSTVAKACAEMMALDATGDEAVQLYVASTGGPVHSAMSLIDTMDLLGVPVHVTCLGRAEGAAVGVVAAGARRVAAPHAQFHLTEPEVSVSGNASQLAAWAEHHRVELERFVERLAEQPRARRSTWKRTCRSAAGSMPRRHCAMGWWTRFGAARGAGSVSGEPPGSGPRRPFGFGPARP